MVPVSFLLSSLPSSILVNVLCVKNDDTNIAMFIVLILVEYNNVPCN